MLTPRSLVVLLAAIVAVAGLACPSSGQAQEVVYYYPTVSYPTTTVYYPPTYSSTVWQWSAPSVVSTYSYYVDVPSWTPSSYVVPTYYTLPVVTPVSSPVVYYYYR